VAVRYTARDRALATGIVNNLVDSYAADRRVGGLRGRERTAMQAQVAAAREASIGSQAKVGGYREAIQIVRKGGDEATTRSEIAAFDEAIKASLAEQSAAAARLREAQGAEAGSETITSPRIRDLRARQAQPTVVPGEQAVDLAEGLAAETRRVTRLAQAARAARVRTQLLRSARDRAAAEQRAASESAAQLREIDAGAAAARARYADLAQRYSRLVSAQRRDPGTAYVISHGVVRSARSFPDPLLFGIGGVLAALVAAAATVLLLEALTKGFRSRQHVERELGLPVIGMVPDLAKVSDADFPADDTMGPPDYLYNHRYSPFSASFRAIHTGLRLGVSGNSLRSVAICSALPEEGKTTVALCLARSAALAGLRVVLVDCDGRRPAASRALSPYVKAGLSHVLEDGMDYRDAIQRDTPSGAWFLAQSSDRAVAQGSIASSRMQALVGQLEQSYDLVLLDMAPALALSESRELAAIADGVLLVTRWRRTPVEATRMAKEMLEKSGARVVATALTLVDP
jgi:succinoglycan biosynthesis transport protein ExoP